MRKLFQESGGDGAVGEVSGARVVGVAVASNVWGTFDYVFPDALGDVEVGQRVRVPFGKGNRKTLGFIVDTFRRPHRKQLKAVTELVDAHSQFDETLWKLGEWIAHYYLTPLGVTLGAMIPSAVGRHATRTETVAYLTSHHKDWGASLGARQRRVLDELYEARSQGIEPVAMESLLKRSGASRDSVRRLSNRKLIRLDSRPVLLPELTDQGAPDPFELNEDQRKVLEVLSQRIGSGFSTTLLYGVTGSGKTEVYIRAIRKVIERGEQGILLVPEIALATQTLGRLLKRLPRVAVLHSALTDAQRAFYYEQIRDGHASVIVGPRSAVFAPTRKLGLIVVDEEHEPTYKQDNPPRYHSRDVAVKRAALAGIPVLLGSATPSLESLHNVQRGKYEMLRLPKRVRGLPLPKLEIVELRKEITPGRIEMIGRTLTRKIAGALDRGEQVILLLNRRGFASYVFCPSCQWTLGCENCTRAMVFHRATQLAMCHYCGHTVQLPERCPACGGKILLFGMGVQRVEGELLRKFPEARMVRMDSDTMTSPGQFRKVFDDFAGGKLDILLGTQMVAKGLDFPRVSLVGVVSGDTSLGIPDFRSSERTFQLIVQVAGRAGRSELPGQVVVQTLHADEPAIRYAVNHDCDAFVQWELPLRRDANLPPFSRMVRFIIRHRRPDKAQSGANEFARRIRRILPPAEITVTGPQVAGVPKIRNQFRFQVLMISRDPGVVQEILGREMESLSRNIPAEIVPDVDPLYLL